MNAEPIVSHRFHTPLGDMLACATEQGLCLLEFVGSRRIEREQQDLSHLLQRRFVFGTNRHIEQTETEIGEYFQGARQRFDVALHMPADAFRQTVWAALREIPYGETTHYQALAERIGRLDAVRAVAAANGANRVSIIVPCHRVIGKDGSLTGYGGGLQRKQRLLEHERGQNRREADLFG
ncbi:methylated-DNA--[protein]-cysteine S-methyltransferase [Neisseria sp. CCUG12390]|uniref:methylated-DNA--[protein]-cysteine S-methyltransferase n=1 Tax=Neisseria sp. CCUG12390 TaxID=3392035 RepID=UPI003A0FD249